MKSSIYELLGMVKDHEEPKKIKYRNNIFEYIGGFGDYKPDDIAKYHGNFLFHYLFEEEVNFLNEEVEILEEPKGIPEKLDHLIGYDIRQFDDLKEYVEITTNDLFGKVNKIIDILNQVLDYLESKGE